MVDLQLRRVRIIDEMKSDRWRFRDTNGLGRSLSTSPYFSAEHIKLTARLYATQFEFLRTVLALCNTFMDGVKTQLEVGNGANAQRAYENAQVAYGTATSLFHHVTIETDRVENEQGLKRVETRLDNLAVHYPFLTKVK